MGYLFGFYAYLLAIICRNSGFLEDFKRSHRRLVRNEIMEIRPIADDRRMPSTARQREFSVGVTLDVEWTK
jgi:hypothetical protein